MHQLLQLSLISLDSLPISALDHDLLPRLHLLRLRLLDVHIVDRGGAVEVQVDNLGLLRFLRRHDLQQAATGLLNHLERHVLHWLLRCGGGLGLGGAFGFGFQVGLRLYLKLVLGRAGCAYVLLEFGVGWG